MVAKSLTAKSLIEDSVKLYSLPDIYFQIREMIRDPRYTAVDIGRVIAKDPALSMRLLRIVNSSFYGFQSRIDTISRAVTIIGIEELQNLALATSIIDSFDNIPDDLINMTDFWIQSIHCAVIAKLLAKKAAVLHCERLFITGLLHDIGALIIYTKLPDQSRQILESNVQNKHHLANLERQVLGFTRADVGGELAESWRLPISISEAIRYQFYPEKANAHKLDAHLLNLTIHLHDSRTRDEFLSTLPSPTLSILRLTEAKIRQVMAAAIDESNTAFDLLAPGKQFH